MLNIEELSISGGGVKGYAYLGALYQLEKIGELNNLKKIIGVSIGSLFASALALGFKAKELINFLFEYNIKEIKDIDITGFLKRKSILKGEKFKEFVIKIIEQKANKDITLKDMYKLTGIELIVVVSCVNDKTVKYISHKTDPDLELLTLILMSSAIPGFLPPVLYNNKFYVDGGILDNNPIRFLSSNAYGICQKLKEKDKSIEINNFIDFFGAILQMIYKSLQNKIKRDHPNLIEVDYGNIQVTSFNITKDEKLSLINYGIISVEKFVNQKFLHEEEPV